MLIELEVFRLPCGPESVEVGLVPDFEIPIPHFVSPVAFGQMSHELVDELVPLLIRLGWRDVPLPPEDRLLATGQRFGHEPQFDDRANLQIPHEEVIHAINVGPVVNELAVSSDFHDVHFLVQQAMESHVFKAAGFFQKPQVALVFRPQMDDRPIRSDRETITRGSTVLSHERHQRESRVTQDCRHEERRLAHKVRCSQVALLRI